MRILVGTMEICRHLHDLGDAFRRLGHEVDTVVGGGNPYYADLSYNYLIDQKKLFQHLAQLVQNPLGTFLKLPDELTRLRHPIDVLVNNAALTVPGRPPQKEAPAAPAPKPRERSTRSGAGSQGFLSFPVKGYRLHFEIGVFGCFRLIQLVLPDMIEARRGAIVNISSGASRSPGEGPYPRPGGPTFLAYGGNKAALEHLTRAVAYEMAPHNIAVNALLPSVGIMTPGLAVMNPTVQPGDTPENFAEAVVRLATADPEVMTGWVALHDEILHPERGRRSLTND